MKKQKFTQEYKEKLDFIMQESSSPKVKEIIAKIYSLPQPAGEILLKLIEGGNL